MLVSGRGRARPCDPLRPVRVTPAPAPGCFLPADANLPKYGLTWHKEPMQGIWDEWLSHYVDKSLADPSLRITHPPAFWDDGELMLS